MKILESNLEEVIQLNETRKQELLKALRQPGEPSAYAHWMPPLLRDSKPLSRTGRAQPESDAVCSIF